MPHQACGDLCGGSRVTRFPTATDAQLFRGLPWHQFSHNEDLRGEDHLLVERQAARPVSLAVTLGTVPKAQFSARFGLPNCPFIRLHTPDSLKTGSHISGTCNVRLSTPHTAQLHTA